MPELDVLIKGGKVFDGTGRPWSYGDVAVTDDRIIGVVSPGAIANDTAREVIEATEMVVCPGFIDIQSHSHMPLMIDGRSVSKITQGVTTEIMGESWTPAPFGGKIKDPFANSLFSHRVPDWEKRARTWTRFRDWLEAMIDHGVSPNIGSFLGGGTLRQYGRGMTMGESSAADTATMRDVTRLAMEDGAFGVSYALIYPPDAYTSTQEIIKMCEVVSEYGGLYITHMRSESAHLLEGIQEALVIARAAKLPVEIYHLKASGKRNWHLMPEAIDLVNRARDDGVDATADMYPYTASGTGLTAVLPPWAAEGGSLFENLRDPQMRSRIRQEMLHPTAGWEPLGDGPESVMPIGFQRDEFKQYVGKRLSEIATLRGQSWVDTVFDLLVAEEQRISTIYFKMTEENIRLQLPLPWMKISTDAGGYDPSWGRALGPVHPRAYGTYPRVLGKYVREESILTLEDAIYKMTWAVAARLGVSDRGQLVKGFLADIVVLDPSTVRDQATFENSHQFSCGVRDVWVNGVRVLRDGVHTGATPGRIVNGPGFR
jgi:N-acyl-D-amino-acid deacylase